MVFINIFLQVTQMASAGIDTVYVSGWQCSSTASTSNEPGPDLADYPMDTVPNKVDHLFKAQLFHDRKQREDRLRMSPQERAKTPKVDYLNPIIADGDTGVSTFFIIYIYIFVLKYTANTYSYLFCLFIYLFIYIFKKLFILAWWCYSCYEVS